MDGVRSRIATLLFWQQIYLGDELVERMQSKATIRGDAPTVPQTQRPGAPALASISARHQERNAPIVAAYLARVYSYRAIAEYFRFTWERCAPEFDSFVIKIPVFEAQP
ncbi:hypothetical protein CCR84_05330 [Rhodocyclus purpureus]|nr:hypothetical protein [Rhodocyclus purpureus]